MTREEVITNLFFLIVGISLLISMKIKSSIVKNILGTLFIVIGLVFLIVQHIDKPSLFKIYQICSYLANALIEILTKMTA